MITEELIQKCLNYFAGHGAGCSNYRRASSLWEASGHSVAAMLEHEDADKWRILAARRVPDLTRSRRWELVRDIQNEGWRCRAACYVPDFASARRWELVRDIRSEYWRSLAADYVPDLTDNQRAELREGK